MIIRVACRMLILQKPVILTVHKIFLVLVARLFLGGVYHLHICIRILALSHRHKSSLANKCYLTISLPFATMQGRLPRPSGQHYSICEISYKTPIIDIVKPVDVA